jgi:hypothetical protein
VRQFFGNNKQNIEAHKRALVFWTGLQKSGCGSSYTLLLTGGYGFHRLFKRSAGLYLNKNDGPASCGDNINFAERTAVASCKDTIEF